MHGNAMNDEQKRETLRMWLGKVYLEYYEAVALLRGYFPNILEKFAEEESVPGRLKLLVQNLEDDIQQFELKVYFDVWYDYGRKIHLDEPDYATPETLNHFIPSGNFASWWIYGKLSASELREWAQNKGIANTFLGTTASHSSSGLNGKLPGPPYKPVADANEAPPQRQQLPQPEVTQEEAARRAGVDQRTIRNWENGLGTPKGYPGRQSRTNFLIFLEGWKLEKSLKREARAKIRAGSGGDMHEYPDEEEEDL
jgi:hypothetical protein